MLAVGSVTLLAWLPHSAPTPSLAPTVAVQRSPQPKITWSAKQLEVILSPGESVTRDLTFTSDRNIQNVVIEPVPALAPFVRVQPNKFANVPAGQQQSVTLNFSIPPGTTLGTYDGTLHVRLGSQTLPQTLKLSINAWSSLTVPTQSLRLKLPDFGIPSQVAIRQPKLAGYLQFVDVEIQIDGQYAPALRMVLYPNPNLLALEDWFRVTIDDPAGTLFNNQTFQSTRLANGRPALIRARGIPAAYLEANGPVEEAYTISSSQDRTVGIVQAQESVLSDLGYSSTAITTLMVKILATLEF